MDSDQPDLLVDLFEIGSLCDSPSPTPTSNDATWGVTHKSRDPTGPAVEVANMVGGQPNNMEPTTELRLPGTTPFSVNDLNRMDYLVPEACNFTLDANFDSSSVESVDPSSCSSTDELLQESELEKLLQPFADNIVNSNCDLDCWDIESLLAV